MWVAFGDESVRFLASPQAYVMAAAVMDVSVIAEVRQAIGDLTLKGTPFHWHNESRQRRQLAVETLAALPALHLVVAGTPMTQPKQDRARNTCLDVLYPLLDAADITEFVMDTRGRKADGRDLLALRHSRSKRLVTGALRLNFADTADEPLLIAADIAAGTVGEALEGNPVYAQIIEHLLEVHKIRIL